MTRTGRWEPSPRRGRRNRLLLAGLLPSLAAVVVASVLLVVLVRQQAGEAALARGDHDAAAAHFAANRWNSAVEPWVAPYDEGVAELLADRPEEALDDFVAALRQVPREHECRVRHNLGVAHEALGDVAVEDAPEETAPALAAYRAGREALAHGACLNRPGALRDASSRLDARLERKILDLLAEQERREREELTPEERERQRRLEEQERRAQEREQRLQEREPDAEEEPETYGW